MKALVTLVRQDALLSWRNGLVLVTVITLGVIVGLYWTLPLFVSGEIELGGSQIYLDQSPDSSIRAILPEADFASSRADLEERVAEGQGLTGIVISGQGQLSFELVYRHPPGESQQNILEAALREIAAVAEGRDRAADIETRVLRPEAPALTANQSLIAVMIAFEVMILGFLFVAVVVFGEKQEGSVRAYRVTPSGLVNYVVSKTLVFSLLSTLYGVVMVISTLGPRAVPALLPVLLLATAVMTVLGLGIAVWFRNISEWFVPGVLALSLNMLAILPYQIPTFSAPWLTWLPGYSVIFGASEILFPTGKSGFAAEMYGTLGLWFAGAVLFALWSVHRNIMREA